MKKIVLFTNVLNTACMGILLIGLACPLISIDFKKAGKAFQTATKDTKKGLKTATKETGKGLKTATKETGKGLKTAGKETGKGIVSTAKATPGGLEVAGKETAKGLELAGRETGEYFVEFGKSEIRPFVEPGQLLKEFKNKKYFGVGSGKTLKPKSKKQATWRIATGCIQAVKAWVVEELSIKAKDYSAMTLEQKTETDIDIIVSQMKLPILFSDTTKWDTALKKNETIKYHRFIGDWDVLEVTSSDNQCINHDFEVNYNAATKKISIKKTK